MKTRKIRHRGVVKILSCSGMKIVRYAFALMCVTIAMSSCEPHRTKYNAMLRTAQREKVECAASGAMLNSDADPTQIAICKKLLKECADCGLLDSSGVRVFEYINRHPSVSHYMELINECSYEDVFADTVMSGDTWQDYVDYVLIPRQDW